MAFIRDFTTSAQESFLLQAERRPDVGGLLTEQTVRHCYCQRCSHTEIFPAAEVATLIKLNQYQIFVRKHGSHDKPAGETVAEAS